MLTYQVRVRLNQYQTADIRIQANNSLECKNIVEAQYGVGSCLNYSQING